MGDACSDNCDGDDEPDDVDTCPDNAKIFHTDFRAIQAVDMGNNSFSQAKPIWQFRNGGKEIYQEVYKFLYIKDSN